MLNLRRRTPMSSDIPLGPVSSSSRSRTSRRSITVHRLPSPAPSNEDVEPRSSPPKDVENSVQDGPVADPYTLRNAVKSEEELSVLRKRAHNGREVEAYHRRQNEVGRELFSLRAVSHGNDGVCWSC